jgi:hypothetical protein
MKNVTVTLDDEAMRWARVRAAEKSMSLSRFLGELVHERMRHSIEYVEAMNGWRNAKPIRLKNDPADRYLTREEAHDRDGLRGR